MFVGIAFVCLQFGQRIGSGLGFAPVPLHSSEYFPRRKCSYGRGLSSENLLQVLTIENPLVDRYLGIIDPWLKNMNHLVEEESLG